MEPGGESQVERAIKALPKAGRGYEAVVLNPKAKLLDQVKELMRLRHYSIRTEQSYSDWIRRYIKFHGLRSREELTPGTEKVEQFLSDLAVNGNVAASTQNQAFNALLFLYREVLRQPFESVKAVRAARPLRVPTVLTPEEVRQVMHAMTGRPQLVVKLLYGAGLRLMEGLRLRVQDLDFGMKQLTVRDGAGRRIAIQCCRKAFWGGCASTWSRFVLSIRRICARAMARCTCLGHWTANIQEPRRSGAGNRFSRRGICPAIRAQGWFAGITWTKQRSIKRSSQRLPGWVSPSASAATPSATVLLRTRSSAGRTFGRFRNCWGTMMSRRRWFTRTFCGWGAAG